MTDSMDLGDTWNKFISGMFIKYNGVLAERRGDKIVWHDLEFDSEESFKTHVDITMQELGERINESINRDENENN